MPETAFLITAFVTLFVVIDPPGMVPMFIALTQGMAPGHRRAVALRACVIAAMLLSLFGLFPGAPIRLRQTRPVPVISLGETELALDRTVAANIQVELV